MLEYKSSRCCMCPQSNSASRICPGITGSTHPNESQCKFVKRYRDERGWVYFVLAGIGLVSGIGQDMYKSLYQKPGKTSVHGWRSVPWRESFDAAQADLNREAKKREWKEV